MVNLFIVLIPIILTKKNAFSFFKKRPQTIKSYYTTPQNTQKAHYLWQTKCKYDRKNQIIQERILSKLLY